MAKLPKDTLAALDEVRDQLYAINSRNISMHWIALRKTPTPEEISNLNALLGFIIKEMDIIMATGKLDVDKAHKEHFNK